MAAVTQLSSPPLISTTARGRFISPSIPERPAIARPARGRVATAHTVCCKTRNKPSYRQHGPAATLKVNTRSPLAPLAGLLIDLCMDKGAPPAFVRALPRRNSAEEPVIPSASEESFEAKSVRWPITDMTTGIAGLDIISPWLGQNQRPGEMLRRSAPQHDTLYRAGRRLCLHDDSLAPRRSIGRGFRFSRRRRRAFGRRSWPSRPVRRIPADLRGRSSIAAQ